MNSQEIRSMRPAAATVAKESHSVNVAESQVNQFADDVIIEELPAFEVALLQGCQDHVGNGVGT
jgi:hypothetical protein